jgi:hypothetical protein
MSLKYNVNKLHSDLSSKFENIEIFEKSSLKWGNYIEFSIKENNINLRAIVSKSDLENNNFNWIYLSNPNNEQSLVERKSTTDSFLDDVKDIFEKNRFDSDYIKSLN